MSGFVGIVPVKADETTQTAWSGLVTPTYFSDMRIPLVRGRAFEPSDDAGAPLVTIVNEALARKMWPAGDALGRTIEVARFDRRKELRQVIGVIRDTRSMGGDLKARGEIYTPFAQAPYPLLNLIVSTSAPADPQLAARIRSIVSNVDPTQVVDRIFPLQEMVDRTVAPWRFDAWLLGAFAAMALLLAAVGLAASIAWWVAQRTREIGVRIALGARPAQVMRLFLKQGVTLTLVGTALGLGGAAASTRLLEDWLYGVTPLDVRTFVGAAVVMLAVALASVWIPARRATRVDPLTALRTE
jgi:putative ABC transport system permease protein